jgi:hypothetical protein
MAKREKVYRPKCALTERQYHATLTWLTRAMKAMPRTDAASIAGVQKLHDGVVNAYWARIGLSANPNAHLKEQDTPLPDGGRND